MKAHDLAKILLDQPNLEVQLMLRCASDSVSSFSEDDTQEIQVGEDSVAEVEVSETEGTICISAFVSEAEFGWMD